MSTHTATRPPEAAEPDTDRRIQDYRTRVELISKRFHRRARRYTVCTNGVSLALVAAGAGIGVTALIPSAAVWTAILGALVVLLEGVTRVLRPAMRAARARRTAAALDREFRLFDARGGHYRTGGPESEVAFVDAVELLLARAASEEERDGSSDTTPAEPAPRRKGLRQVV
jgi:Protein of unknown function (DUF4231)